MDGEIARCRRWDSNAKAWRRRKEPCRDVTLLSCAGRVWEDDIVATHPTTKELFAPDTLGLETRDRIRKDAIKLLNALPEGSGQLVIDLGATRQVDSAGLGSLMLIQRHAAERRQAVALRNVSEELRFLLVLTRLDELFESATQTTA